MDNQNNPTFTPLKSLFIIFEISRFGRIKNILPVAQNEGEEKVLMRALSRWRSAGRRTIGNE